MAQPEINSAEDNQRVVPGRSVRLSGELARVGVPGKSAAGAPRIHVVRAGDVVQLVEITCTCGEHIRLRCMQGPAGAS
jgi:hypothetical protein